MPRVAVWGDLHLGKLSHKVENHLELQFLCLNKMMKEVKEHGLKRVVLLGDVFDKPSVTPSIVIELIRFFLNNKEIVFDWVMGNHDRTSKAEATVDIINELATLKALPNLTIYEKPTAIDGLGFLPYPHKKPLKDTVLSFAHVDRPGARMDTGRIISEKGKWNEDHFFVIGHIHTAQKVGKRSYYTGSPFQLSFGEKVDKHWAIVSYDKKDASAFSYKKIPIPPVYELINLTISSKKQLKEIKPHPKYYKITIGEGIKLPPNFLIENPNVELRGFQVKHDKDSKVLVSDQAIQVNVTYKLEEYLDKKGLTTEEKEWCIKIVNKKIKHLIQSKN